MNTANTPIYQPRPEWQTLSQYMVTMAVEKYGNPFENYRLDSATGHFVSNSVDQETTRLGPNAFSLPGIAYAIYYQRYNDEFPPEDLPCGYHPIDSSGKHFEHDVVIKLWEQACDELLAAIQAKQVILWAQISVSGTEFRPVAWKLMFHSMQWHREKKINPPASSTSFPKSHCDRPVFPQDRYEWLAPVVFEDRFDTPDGKGISLLHAELVPIVAVNESDGPEIMHSRRVGRPSSFPLVRAEFYRRRESKSALPVFADEARYLSEWLAKEHPNERPMKPKSIENALRREFRHQQSVEGPKALNGQL